jgi:hypothetical protein
MENIENELADARMILNDIRREKGTDVIVDIVNGSIRFTTSNDGYPVSYHLHGGTQVQHYDVDDTHVWTVSPVGPLLAGAVLAAIQPHDARIKRGIALAAFAELLEDLFPHAAVDWCCQRVGRPGDYELRVYIDPLQHSYYEKVKQLFPVWSWGDWYICGGGYYFLSRDTPPCDMGAYLWVTSG